MNKRQFFCGVAAIPIASLPVVAPDAVWKVDAIFQSYMSANPGGPPGRWHAWVHHPDGTPITISAPRREDLLKIVDMSARDWGKYYKALLGG